MCSKLLNKQELKNSSSCAKNEEWLEKGLGIVIKNDSTNTHPTTVCSSCRTKSRQYVERKVESALVAHTWVPHSGENCQECQFFLSQAKGGHPPKERKNRGRPKALSAKGVSRAITELALPSLRVSQPLSLDRFLPGAVSLIDLQCAVCKCIVDSPVQTPCGKLVCCQCIVPVVEKAAFPTIPCPSCSETHEISSPASFSPPPKRISRILSSLLIQCEKPQCTKVVQLGHLQAHISSGCQSVGTGTSSPSKLTISHVLTRPLSSPPTLLEQKAASHVVKRMLACSSESPSSAVVNLPTQGQVGLINLSKTHVCA